MIELLTTVSKNGPTNLLSQCRSFPGFLTFWLVYILRQILRQQVCRTILRRTPFFWNVKRSNNWNQLFTTNMWKCALQQFSFENWMMIWTQLASYLNLTFILDKNIFEHNLLFFCSIKNNIFICPSTASWKCILPRGQLCHYGRISKLLASVSVTLMFWGSQKILRRTPERTHILFLIIKYIDPI